MSDISSLQNVLHSLTVKEKEKREFVRREECELSECEHE